MKAESCSVRRFVVGRTKSFNTNERDAMTPSCINDVCRRSRMKLFFTAIPVGFRAWNDGRALSVGKVAAFFGQPPTRIWACAHSRRAHVALYQGNPFWAAAQNFWAAAQNLLGRCPKPSGNAPIVGRSSCSHHRPHAAAPLLQMAIHTIHYQK